MTRLRADTGVTKNQDELGAESGRRRGRCVTRSATVTRASRQFEEQYAIILKLIARPS